MASSRSFFALLVAVINAGVAFAGIGPVTTLTISNGNVSPDGFTRAATLTNGKIDGPLITGQKGDNFQLTVVNNLNDNTMYQTTTIHWHGFFQAGSAWADGPAFVTQCPITKGNSFLYNFNALNQAGTFWYHGHLATQYCDGLRGPFVVYDPNDPYLSQYDVDDDTTVITLSDWYHAVSKQAGAVPTPDATLINGLGRYTGATTAPLSVISVTHGTRYRFRLLNMACDPNYIFSIDGHTFTVIEADGVSVQPLVVDSIPIFAGQRYSFILEADQAVDNYWVRAKPNRAAQTTFANGLNTAILRYVGAPASDPSTNPTTSPTLSSTLVEASMVPLGTNLAAPGTPTPGGANKVWNLAITFSGGQFAINGVPFVNPSVPVLLQILSGAQTPSSLLPSGSIYSISPGDVIELTIPGGTVGAPHPFHLHGHTFYVVRSAGQTTPNYVNPPRRDVVSTGTSTSDNVTIRFVADNPGPWFLHCHIDWHLNAGLALVFAEDAADWVADIPVPAAWNQLCTNYDNADPSDL